MLLFYVGDDRYALECKQVVEVVPLVTLKKLHHAPDYIAGLFNYRSRLVPVIDLCHLIQGHHCRPNLSTRIILVNYRSSTPSSVSEATPEEQDYLTNIAYPSDKTPLEETPTLQVLGLMAERVTETLDQPETEFVDPGMTVNAAPYLGKIITNQQEMIQCIHLEFLLPEAQQAYLLTGNQL